MKAKKSLGQNFLIDNNIIKQIINLFECNEDDLIIEIGPGRGALTEQLTKLKSKLLCIEIDLDMKKYLDKYISDKCSILYEDILSVNLKEILKSYDYKRLYVIGNLPYYITSPIIEHIISSGIFPNEMIFMVQKEVAERYSAKPGNREYGYMTVFLDHFYDVSLEVQVPSYCFNPEPKVDSAVIKLKFKESKVSINDKKYFEFLKECFKLKRKTMKNNLKKYDWEVIKEALKQYNLPETTRSEELPKDVFIHIYQKINENKIK